MASVRRERPQLREESVENVLKRAGSVCHVCWVPLLLLSLVSTLSGTVRDSYTPSTNASLQPFNKLSPPEEQQLAKENTSSSSQENNMRVSRLGFHEEEGSQDKGLLARHLATFVMFLDEAVMESSVESKNRIAMYESGGKQSKTVDPPLPSQIRKQFPLALMFLQTWRSKE